MFFGNTFGLLRNHLNQQSTGLNQQPSIMGGMYNRASQMAQQQRMQQPMQQPMQQGAGSPGGGWMGGLIGRAMRPQMEQQQTAAQQLGLMKNRRFTQPPQPPVMSQGPTGINAMNSGQMMRRRFGRG